MSTYNTQPATIAFLPRGKPNHVIQRVKNAFTSTEDRELEVVQKLQNKGALKRRSRRISLSSSGENQTFLCGEDGPVSMQSYFATRRATPVVQATSLSCVTFQLAQLLPGNDLPFTTITVDFRELFSMDEWFRQLMPQQDWQTVIVPRGSTYFTSSPTIIHHKLIPGSDATETGLLLLVAIGQHVDITNSVEAKWVYISGFRQKMELLVNRNSTGIFMISASQWPSPTCLPGTILLPKDQVSSHASFYHCSENFLVYFASSYTEVVVWNLKNSSFFRANLEGPPSLRSIPAVTYAEFSGAGEKRFKVSMVADNERRDWVLRLHLETYSITVNPIIAQTAN